MTNSINNNYIADIVWFVGNDFETISRGLFEIFRYVDNHNIDVIIAEEMDCVDLGLAIMDRLKKGSKGNNNTVD